MKPTTRAQLATSIANRYGISEERARAGVDNVLAQLAADPDTADLFDPADPDAVALPLAIIVQGSFAAHPPNRD